MAPWVISHFPKHEIYLEPFGGGASVLMRKPRSYAEIYNDLDGDIVNVFRVLQDTGKMEKLKTMLEVTPFSRLEFELAYEPCDDEIERARRTIVRSHFGIGENATTGFKTGFRSNSFATGTHIGDTWINYRNHLPSFAERLMGVVIEQKDALDLMASIDAPNVLHFVDPPYVTSTRVVKRGYRHEMDDDKHGALCEILKTLTGAVVLCGYKNEIYDSLKWETSNLKTKTGNTAEREEILWLNPKAWENQAQSSFAI